MFNINNIKKIHFIGIGGIGISGIAEIFFKKGYIISGSDIIENRLILNLKKIGINEIYIGHKFSNINKPDIVVISSAIKYNNIEVIEANKLKIPILNRGEILKKLIYNYYSICISGSHGKTTITSIISFLFIFNKYNITFISGGILKNFNSNCNLGNNKYFVLESDESDLTFLKLNPNIAIISNIDNDHLNSYNNNFKNIKKSFCKFINNIDCNGLLITCLDDLNINNIINNVKFKCKIITYGFSNSSDVIIYNYSQNKFNSCFSLKSIKYKNINFSNIKLKKLPGIYNTYNVTSSIILLILNNFKIDNIRKSLLKFKGIEKRFELIKYKFNDLSLYKKKIFFISDYGHHPSEIDSVIYSLRLGWKKYNIIMLFQPHRYTRTNYLFNDFIKVLIKVDFLILFDIFSAGEKNIYNINSEKLFVEIEKYKKDSVFYIKNIKNISYIIKNLIKNKNIILIQGAGDINNIIINNLNL